LSEEGEDYAEGRTDEQQRACLRHWSQRRPTKQIPTGPRAGTKFQTCRPIAFPNSFPQ